MDVRVAVRLDVGAAAALGVEEDAARLGAERVGAVEDVVFRARLGGCVAHAMLAREGAGRERGDYHDVCDVSSLSCMSARGRICVDE